MLCRGRISSTLVKEGTAELVDVKGVDELESTRVWVFGHRFRVNGMIYSIGLMDDGEMEAAKPFAVVQMVEIGVELVFVGQNGKRPILLLVLVAFAFEGIL